MPCDPNEALRRLKEGNQRFAEDKPLRPATYAEKRQALSVAQEPIAHVFTCSDSRVGPEIIFDQGLGDLFVTRVAGNVYGEVVLGTLEFSVAVLDIPLLVVLGHSACAAVLATVRKQQIPGQSSYIQNLIQPAVDRAAAMPGDLETNAIRENVLLRCESLRISQPVLEPRLRQGRLEIVGGIYDLVSGTVDWL
jgi:carbonic anhydrase